MGSAKKGGSHTPRDDDRIASLTRIDQTARMRNSHKHASQGELPLEAAEPIDQIGAEGRGVFEIDVWNKQGAIDRSGMPTTNTLNELLDAHRMLSERIVAANRELARVTRPDNLDSQEVRNVRNSLDEMRAQRRRLDAVIEGQLKAIKTRSSEEDNADASPVEAQVQGGLVKVRHPNRDFFLADLFDYALKDDGASMEAPIFTLATKPDLSIWEWRSKDESKYVKVVPSALGRATQHDKDVLIYVCSQMVAGLDRGREDAKNRTVRFTVYDFLVTTNRQTSGEGYRLLQDAFERLRGTSITTDIRTGGKRIKQGFGIIDEWRIIQKSQTDERMVAVEVTLSRWLFHAIQAYEVLTIHPDYFRLRKPLARRLYELARKHCGHQAQWKIGLELLQAKSGSKSTLREFRRAVRAIEADNSLPEYRLILNDDDTVTFHTKDAQRLLARIAGRL
ncbi:replication initiator protein A [Candidatus Igneacidithiobacillus taiwanensis]|uniref:replication initiator protein A n=1 Tax=Candidatus Igneacidithiobacillus taiwanensis TaxID=1945924 RepID=UPI00289A5F5B|nr:replication initiator protein A [Candidatus Igneacidithiobacillus taiwanensis]